MTTKHTPGPWTIKAYNRSDKQIWLPEPDVYINYDDVNHDEQDANARLIATAPELLEALEGLRSIAYRLDGCPDPKCLVCKENREKLAAADAAIAKAVPS